MYLLLKTIHVVVGMSLMALIVGVVAPVIYGLRCYPTDWQKRTLKRSLFLSVLAVIPLSIVQLMLGFSVIAVHPYAVSLFWVKASLVAFCVYLLSWCASVSCLSKWRLLRGESVRNSSELSIKGCFSAWLIWIIIAVLSLLTMVFMMANRITL